MPIVAEETFAPILYVLRYQSTLRGLATGDPRIIKALQVLSFNMNMVADPIDAAIVHTHAHLDHIMATRDVKEAHGGDIALHPDDLFLYDGIAMQAAMFGWQTRPVDDSIAETAQSLVERSLAGAASR